MRNGMKLSGYLVKINVRIFRVKERERQTENKKIGRERENDNRKCDKAVGKGG